MTASYDAAVTSPDDAFHARAAPVSTDEANQDLIGIQPD